MILFKPAKHLELWKLFCKAQEDHTLDVTEVRWGGWEERVYWRQSTHNEAKFLIIPRVHGLALLHAATAVIRFRLRIKSNSSKFKYDVSLSLKESEREEKRGKRESCFHCVM